MILDSKQKLKVARRVAFDLQLTGKPLSYTPPQLACVYALEMSDRTVKIGVTTNLEKRIKQVSGAVCLDVLNVHHTGFAPFGFMNSVEKECHQTFSNKRVRGEFFDITFEEARAELDRHKEAIDAELKSADEEYLAAVEYWERLAEACRLITQKNGKKKVLRITIADDKHVLAVVDENGIVQSTREFTNLKDAQSAVDMIWLVLVKFCGEEPPEGLEFWKQSNTMHFDDFYDAYLTVYSDTALIEQ